MSDLQKGLTVFDQHGFRSARQCQESGGAIVGRPESEQGDGEQGKQARMHAALCAVVALALAVGCKGPEPVLRPSPAPTSDPAPDAKPDEPLLCNAIERVEIAKRERRLTAYCAGGARFEATISVGREPLGHKEATGDLRTPEGAYHISGALEPSRFHGFIPIDYPSIDDAAGALARGFISRVDYQRIAAAHRRGEQPPGDTPLGGGIGLHGEGARWRGNSGHLDWTLGCIAVEDSTLDFLAERMEVGTPVLILP